MKIRFLVVLLAALVAGCQEKKTETIADEHASHPGLQKEKESPALNSNFNGMRVEFKSGEGSGSAYLSVPSTPGKNPAIIVIQEWWGLDDWIKEQTDRAAGQGYVAMAVDLYRGRTTIDPGEAHELARGLPEDRAMSDLKGAVDFLASRPDVDPSRIGVVGWCMGGGYALRLAAAEPRVKAAVINYGSLLTDRQAIQGIQGSVLGNFGEADRGIPVEDVRMFQQIAQGAGKNVDIKLYPGAGHAFMNPRNTEGYNPSAAQDAQQRIDQFFKTQLRPSQND